MHKEEKKHKSKPKTLVGKIWYFIWDDDSVLSWIVNIVIAFVLIKFVIYPGLGWALGTTHPVVAVVSGSMEHKTVHPCGKYDLTSQGYYVCAYHNPDLYEICGKTFDSNNDVNLDFFWQTCGDYYGQFNISKDAFSKFSFKNGFNTGDIIVLLGKKPKEINVGDVIVFTANQPDPIIHRVIRKWQEADGFHFQTKGDHNPYSMSAPVFEDNIREDRVIGKAYFRIPYLGYIKIWFVDLLNLIGLGNSVGRLF